MNRRCLLMLLPLALLTVEMSVTSVFCEVEVGHSDGWARSQRQVINILAGKTHRVSAANGNPDERHRIKGVSLD